MRSKWPRPKAVNKGERQRTTQVPPIDLEVANLALIETAKKRKAEKEAEEERRRRGMH